MPSYWKAPKPSSSIWNVAPHAKELVHCSEIDGRVKYILLSDAAALQGPWLIVPFYNRQPVGWCTRHQERLLNMLWVSIKIFLNPETEKVRLGQTLKGPFSPRIQAFDHGRELEW
mmetsp:Transcript_16432/g.33513  ORF Transcript_16432/g.33513 Transcript_16432/m.33513 type:complete len:115 (-) Transcript_16432:873-1217(-)